MLRETTESETAVPAPVPHEESENHTAYWTLSLYIEAERIFGPAEGKSSPLLAGTPYHARTVAKLQTAGIVTRALRDTIEPLFNDIADREWLEGTHDFLFAAGSGDDYIPDAPDRRHAAAARAREAQDLSIHVPPEIAWSTEGIRFVSAPRGLDRPRRIRLRRFWFVHNNGAVTYNLSFTLPYRPDAGDFTFLSILQKLAAPKEFALNDATLAAMRDPDFQASPLQDAPLGIGPLDSVTLCACPATGCAAGCARQRFWPFIAAQFAADAPAFFTRLAGAFGQLRPDPARLTLEKMVGLTPIIEVPGLHMPRNRYMVLIRDEGFFARLIPPINPATGTRYPRKMMIQDRCFAPYADKIAALCTSSAAEVRLDPASFWTWAEQRPDMPSEYRHASDDQIAAIRAGDFRDAAGNAVHIPSFARGRTDCLETLFLSGFNQNIIDFMNQDTSEILDSLDPIYPKTDDQLDERFFVRFANHRGMITYVPRSRSLEVGNDYIGTCPYAFLIHALALHNEFLARRQESLSFAAIMKIEAEVDAKRRDDRTRLPSYQDIGISINDIKVEYSRDYERYRHANVFRYDTERDVFEELEKLRGTDRKQQALQRAIANLEDQARDLDLLQQRADTERQEGRDRSLNAVLATLGLFGSVQILFALADYFEDHDRPMIDTAATRAIAHAAGPLLGNLAWLLASIGLIALIPLFGWALYRWRTIGRFFLDLPARLSRAIAQQRNRE